MRCVIVGGGLSGLTLLHDLRRRGVDTRLVERTRRAGGLARSDRQNGFLCDSEPTGFEAAQPAVRQLLLDLGLAYRVIPVAPAAQCTGIIAAGRMVLAPRAPLEVVRSPLFATRDKLRLLADFALTRPARPQAGLGWLTQLGHDEASWFRAAVRGAAATPETA